VGQAERGWADDGKKASISGLAGDAGHAAAWCLGVDGEASEY